LVALAPSDHFDLHAAARHAHASLSLVFLFFFSRLSSAALTIVKLLMRAAPIGAREHGREGPTKQTSVLSAPPTIPDRLIQMPIMPHKIRTNGINERIRSCHFEP